LSNTNDIGPDVVARKFASNSSIVSDDTSVVLLRTNSPVVAFQAPNTLCRLRPEAPRIIIRTRHHAQHKYTPRTKWAVSTK